MSLTNRKFIEHQTLLNSQMDKNRLQISSNTDIVSKLDSKVNTNTIRLDELMKKCGLNSSKINELNVQKMDRRSFEILMKERE